MDFVQFPRKLCDWRIGVVLFSASDWTSIQSSIESTAKPRDGLDAISDTRKYPPAAATDPTPAAINRRLVRRGLHARIGRSSTRESDREIRIDGH